MTAQFIKILRALSKYSLGYESNAGLMGVAAKCHREREKGNELLIRKALISGAARKESFLDIFSETSFEVQEI